MVDTDTVITPYVHYCQHKFWFLLSPQWSNYEWSHSVSSLRSGVTISKNVHSLLLLSLYQGILSTEKNWKVKKFYPTFYLGGVTVEDMHDSTAKSGEILIDGSVLAEQT